LQCPHHALGNVFLLDQFQAGRGLQLLAQFLHLYRITKISKKKMSTRPQHPRDFLKKPFNVPVAMTAFHIDYRVKRAVRQRQVLSVA
jgi:hypothetical protein